MAIAIIFLILSTTVIILNTLMKFIIYDLVVKKSIPHFEKLRTSQLSHVRATYNQLRGTRYFFLKYAISFSSLLYIVAEISVYCSHLKFYNVIL